MPIDVQIERDLERLIICSKADPWNILQPDRKTSKIMRQKIGKEPQILKHIKEKLSLLLPKVPFCTYIWSNPKMHVKSSFMDQLDEPNQIISPVKIILGKKKYRNNQCDNRKCKNNYEKTEETEFKEQSTLPGEGS
jgi:hypothetical protein